MTSVAAAPSTHTATTALMQHTLIERRRLLLGICFAGFALAMLTTMLYPSLGAEYNELLDDMPPALTSMLGEAELGTIEGWLQVEVFSFVGPGLALGAAIVMGAGSLAGSEEQGQLALISAAPVRRASIVGAGLGGVILSAVLTSLSLLLGVVAGGALAGVSISLTSLLAACFSLTLLATSVGSIALMVGATTPRRSRAIAVAVTISLISYVVATFFPMNTSLAPWAKASLWHLFASNQPLVNGVRWDHSLLLIACSAVAAAVAFLAFERRDLSG